MDYKRIGEIYETELIFELMKRGYFVSTPYGESAPYDLIVDNNSKLLKIQVKTTTTFDKGRSHYRVTTAHGSKSKKPYNQKDVNIFACKVVPTNDWFFVRNEGQKKVNLNNKTANNFDLIRDMI
jgi:hypothetical protein